MILIRWNDWKWRWAHEEIKIIEGIEPRSVRLRACLSSFAPSFLFSSQRIPSSSPSFHDLLPIHCFEIGIQSHAFKPHTSIILNDLSKRENSKWTCQHHFGSCRCCTKRRPTHTSGDPQHPHRTGGTSRFLKDLPSPFLSFSFLSITTLSRNTKAQSSVHNKLELLLYFLPLSLQNLFCLKIVLFTISKIEAKQNTAVNTTRLVFSLFSLFTSTRKTPHEFLRTSTCSSCCGSSLLFFFFRSPSSDFLTVNIYESIIMEESVLVRYYLFR